MSDFNLEWLEENFKNKSAIIYNIGCAQLSDDSLRFQTCLPDATVYSFDCASHWKDSNKLESKIYNLHYLHCAVSNVVGKKSFSYKTKDADFYEYSSSLSSDIEDIDRCEIVDCITIDEFCKTNPAPTILHIDAEHDEYNILQSVSHKNFPCVIWLETNDFYNNAESKLEVSYHSLCEFLTKNNYELVINTKLDSLFVKKNYKTSPYNHVIAQNDVWSEHEKALQEKLWLKKYYLIKGFSWPDLTSVLDFDYLSDEIKQECIEIYNLVIDSRFFK